MEGAQFRGGWNVGSVFREIRLFGDVGFRHQVSGVGKGRWPTGIMRRVRLCGHRYEMLKADRCEFDPARHGFGFRNPVGVVPARGGGIFLRLDPFLYGNGLCLGMAAAALHEFSKGSDGRLLSELPLSSGLLDELLALHARQYRPSTIATVILDWLKNGGGKPDGILFRIRLPESGGPRILCFGPRLNRSFLRCMRQAHAVVPYRMESSPDGIRVHVYDPNYPKSRSRYVSFGEDGGFRYGGVSAENGWGITLLPLSALGGRPI